MTRQLNQGTRLVAAIVALSSLSVATVGPARGQRSAPVLVSPGALDGEAIVLDRCPTFSWAAGDRSVEQELVVYRTRPEAGGPEGDGLIDDSPIVRALLPAGASVWTPSVAECLEPGGSYAWTLRQLSTGTLEAASAEARLFRVAAAPAFSAAISPSTSEAGNAPEVLRDHSQQESPFAQVPPAKATTSSLTASDEPPAADLAATSSAPSPTLGPASLALEEQLHLGSSSDVFRNGQLFLWTDLAANLALGSRALESNTTGLLNSAVGSSALRANTTGISNAAFGVGAMIYNTEGSANSGFGTYAMLDNETGYDNSAFGSQAMRENTTGNYNSAVGQGALLANKTGSRNTAIGREAMYSTTVTDGTAVGDRALRSNSGGLRNTAVGARSLFSSTTGASNVAVGWLAGYDVLEGSDNIMIGAGVSGLVTDDKTIRIGNQGTQAQTHIAGISGVALSEGANVVVESDGRLGVGASSQRFKEDVREMEDVSEVLSALRPVRFRYKEEHSRSDERTLQYGLIAEEVARVLPELVARGTDGRPFAVRYDLLSTLLLQELRRVSEQNDSVDLVQARLLGAQRNEIEALKRQLARLERQRE